MYLITVEGGDGSGKQRQAGKDCQDVHPRRPGRPRPQAPRVLEHDGTDQHQDPQQDETGRKNNAPGTFAANHQQGPEKCWDRQVTEVAQKDLRH